MEKLLTHRFTSQKLLDPPLRAFPGSTPDEIQMKK